MEIIPMSNPPRLEVQSECQYECMSGSWSDFFQDFTTRCTRLDPAERPSAAEMLEHPFLQQAASMEQMEKRLTTMVIERTKEESNEEPAPPSRTPRSSPSHMPADSSTNSDKQSGTSASETCPTSTSSHDSTSLRDFGEAVAAAPPTCPFLWRTPMGRI